MFLPERLRSCQRSSLSLSGWPLVLQAEFRWAPLIESLSLCARVLSDLIVSSLLSLWPTAVAPFFLTQLVSCWIKLSLHHLRLMIQPLQFLSLMLS